ncbi:hypothetical protein QE369_002463 [Agrobacterium larrymoorei]|uniref:Uncharacterized protein n=1 Tax=Agrobacterium larrymoorei TaxID=160699 RepID=A0AAJ2ERM5_9HYPH|nr:hypothetical protein [Agrobacterium larrymoorei]
MEIAFKERGMTFLEGPDVSQKFEVGQRFRTTVSHIRSHSSVIAHHPARNPRQTCKARHTHPDHDVGSWQTKVEGGGIASVQYPAITSDDVLDDAMLLGPVALRPIRKPAHVSVYREIFGFKMMRDLPRKRRLSRT